MITRKIGKLLRGNVTPVQVMLAAVLGAMLGFVPSFGTGPGLIVFLSLLLVILNANLFVAMMCGLLAKAMSLLLLPVTFMVGRVLLDGPTQPIFKAMINAPVLALFGLEYYVTTGGIVVGLLVGLGLGLALVRGINTFRRKMAKLEEGSPRFNQLAGAWWARILLFVFVGKGHGKKTYQDLLQRKIGNPIRPVGAVLAVLAVVGLFIVAQFASGPIVTAALKNGLERVNGATVDIDDAELDLSEGRLVVTGFAMADPNRLDTDLLRADRIEADISGVDLLRKRLVIDRVVMIDASHGEQRAIPGRIVGKPPTVSKGDDAEGIGIPSGEQLEHYIKKAKQWKERLAQIRRWLERLSGPDETGDGEGTFKERLAQRIRDLGYPRVKADHLIDGSPTLTITRLIAKEVDTPYLPDETFDIRGENLSTHPHLLDERPRLLVRSSGKTVELDARLRGAADAKPNRLKFQLRNFPIDTIASQLAFAGSPPFSGGTMDVVADGTWLGGAAGSVDLPLIVTLRNTTLSLAGRTATNIDELVLPIGVRGPIDNPRITIDDQALTDALVKAGASELAGQLQGEIDKQLEGVGIKLPGELGDTGEAIKKGLSDLLGGKKKDDD